MGSHHLRHSRTVLQHFPFHIVSDDANNVPVVFLTLHILLLPPPFSRTLTLIVHKRLSIFYIDNLAGPSNRLFDFILRGVFIIVSNGESLGIRALAAVKGDRSESIADEIQTQDLTGGPHMTLGPLISCNAHKSKNGL